MDIKTLCQLYQSGKKIKYLFFWGHQTTHINHITKSCLSQWYPAEFIVGDVKYASTEHYMMAEKARLFNDLDALEKIINAKNPGAAKAFGREICGFSQPVWDEHRLKIVIEGNLAKFSQNKPLEEFLLNTGKKILVEASPVDRIWGVGLAEDSPDIQNPLMWNGLNLLGFALMVVRDRLRS
ncbi:NADAR family protein [Xenorhabdus szentirmaii]|uniref:NADAR family protein n=1 Tax=Xenorhabdus szentirmaii TaxID=290112 RepID=UPI0019AB8329|nr:MULTISPECIES: NADAR family protein [unclassified Xenorhabdus]MBD2779833.1 NADAR family protein [Xenorhabdus sp. 38]MBD2807187.1 NADAR family protein [Xenorhabdus sp. ZM]